MLYRSLKEVTDILQLQSGRKGLARVLSLAKDAGEISECKANIDEQLITFAVRTFNDTTYKIY